MISLRSYIKHSKKRFIGVLYLEVGWKRNSAVPRFIQSTSPYPDEETLFLGLHILLPKLMKLLVLSTGKCFFIVLFCKWKFMEFPTDKWLVKSVKRQPSFTTCLAMPTKIGLRVAEGVLRLVLFCNVATAIAWSVSTICIAMLSSALCWHLQWDFII